MSTSYSSMRYLLSKSPRRHRAQIIELDRTIQTSLIRHVVLLLQNSQTLHVEKPLQPRPDWPAKLGDTHQVFGRHVGRSELAK
jgi:hypothetical protein